ncbi:MAG: sensor histidine kinase [Planctomycetota bacterium]
MNTRWLAGAAVLLVLAGSAAAGVAIRAQLDDLEARQERAHELIDTIARGGPESAPALDEARQVLTRSRKRMSAVGSDLLQFVWLGGPLVVALGALLIAFGVARPLRRASRARSPRDAAEALEGLSTDLAALLRGLDAERQQRILELLRASHLAALGTMAASMAHEVRTPLAAVAGLAESCRRKLAAGEPGLDLAAELRRIEDESFRASRLLGDFLATSPRGAEAVERFDVVHEAREAARIAAARVGANVESILVTAPAHIVCEGRPSEWRQVLLNLLMNALVATRTAGRGLEPACVALEIADRADDVVLEVRDHGVGFSALDAPRLFEPFFSRLPGGSGLGLFLCAGIVRGAGGAIDAESAGAGCGARFVVRLPRIVKTEVA